METGLCKDPEGFRFHQNMTIPDEFKPKVAYGFTKGPMKEGFC